VVTGNGQRLFAIIHDVTEQEKDKAALAESEERLRLAQDAANAGTWEWDLTTNANYWSDKVFLLYGLDPARATASYDAWLGSIHPDDRTAAAKSVGDAAAARIPIHNEWRVNLPLMQERWLMSRGQPVTDSTGTVVKYRGIVIDITERKRTEREREFLIRDLEQKNAELERFTYTVSHDLKSPLITIKGFAGLLEEDAAKGTTDQFHRDILRITTAADVMQTLLNDVLELSRVGRVVSPPERTGFGDIARETAELLAGPLAENGVRIEIQPDLPDVYVDHHRIREALTNLVENALKFSAGIPDPVVRIGSEKTKDGLVFFVRDNGRGIDPRYLGRIFNLFEKLDPSSPGTGIGLAIVKRIIEVHGGKIWAESEGPGRGTTIRFTLPAAEPARTDTNNKGKI